jgi:hypothetical protein
MFYRLPPEPLLCGLGLFTGVLGEVSSNTPLALLEVILPELTDCTPIAFLMKEQVNP